MLVLNVDSWSTGPSDLIDYGRDWAFDWEFSPISERVGCDITAIQDQWVSMKILINGQFSK